MVVGGVGAIDVGVCIGCVVTAATTGAGAAVVFGMASIAGLVSVAGVEEIVAAVGIVATTGFEAAVTFVGGIGIVGRAAVGFAMTGAEGAMGAMEGDAGGILNIGAMNKSVDRKILIKNKR